jgi:hypothetical protein
MGKYCLNFLIDGSFYALVLKESSKAFQQRDRFHISPVFLHPTFSATPKSTLVFI